MPLNFSAWTLSGEDIAKLSRTKVVPEPDPQKLVHMLPWKGQVLCPLKLAMNRYKLFQKPLHSSSQDRFLFRLSTYTSGYPFCSQVGFSQSFRIDETSRYRTNAMQWSTTMLPIFWCAREQAHSGSVTLDVASVFSQKDKALDLRMVILVSQPPTPPESWW